MKTTLAAIEFASPSSTAVLETLLHRRTTESGKFRDLTLKPEYRSRALRLPQGTTWLRFLPAIKGSVAPWFLEIERLELATAKMIYPTGPLIEKTKAYLRAAEPTKIYTKENKSGAKLWPKPYMLSWCIVETQPAGERLKLFGASSYDGGRGANPGLGRKIIVAAGEVDAEPGSPTFGSRKHPELTDPENGRMVGITRTGAGQTSAYQCKIGTAPSVLSNARIEELLTEEECSMVRPLEEVVQPADDAILEEMLIAELGQKVVDSIVRG
jgi:hypothetical protein